MVVTPKGGFLWGFLNPPFVGNEKGPRFFFNPVGPPKGPRPGDFFFRGPTRQKGKGQTPCLVGPFFGVPPFGGDWGFAPGERFFPGFQIFGFGAGGNPGGEFFMKPFHWAWGYKGVLTPENEKNRRGENLGGFPRKQFPPFWVWRTPPQRGDISPVWGGIFPWETRKGAPPGIFKEF